VYFLGENADNGCNCPACRCAKEHDTQAAAPGCKKDCNCATGKCTCNAQSGEITAHTHAPHGQAHHGPQYFEVELAGAHCQEACCPHEGCPHEGCTDVSFSPGHHWPIGQPCTIADSKGRTHQGVLCHANDEWLVLDTGHGRKWIRASIVETVTEQPDHVGYATDECAEACVQTHMTAEGLIFSHPVNFGLARCATGCPPCPTDCQACEKAAPRNKLRATVKLQSTPPFFGIDIHKTKAEECEDAPEDAPKDLPPPHLPVPPQRTVAAPPESPDAAYPAGIEIAVQPRIVGGHVAAVTTTRPAHNETQYAIELKLTKNEDGQKTVTAPRLVVTADHTGHIAVGDFKCGVRVKEGHEGYLTLQVFSGPHVSYPQATGTMNYPRATCTMKSGDGVTLAWGDNAALEVKVHRMEDPEHVTRRTTP
jgi:hypothetical protein